MPLTASKIIVSFFVTILSLFLHIFTGITQSSPVDLFSYIIIRITFIFLSKQNISNVIAKSFVQSEISKAIPEIPKLPVITPNTIEPITAGWSPSIVMMPVCTMSL